MKRSGEYDGLILGWIAACGLLAYPIYVDILALPAPKAADVPAWVQAIGSVAAIVAAAWIASHDRREQARLREMEALETAGVVIAEGFWVAARLVRKMPFTEARRTKARESWPRVRRHWASAIKRIDKNPPLIPEQYTAQLIVRARLDRALSLYRTAIDRELSEHEILDLDLAVGRIHREVRALSSPFQARGARGPLDHLSGGEARDLELRLCAEFMSAARMVLAETVRTQYNWQRRHAEAHQHLLSRRRAQLDRLAGEDGGVGGQRAARRLRVVSMRLERFLEACVEQDVTDQPAPRNFHRIDASLKRAIRGVAQIKIVKDPGN